MITTEFIVTALIVVLLPGTGVIYTISTGLFLGSRASILASIGCTIGIVPHLIATIFGLAALLHVSAVAFQVVKFIGVAYLFYLAWGMWKDTGTFELKKDGKKRDGFGIVLKGFLINILNPKLSIFFLAFLPQFVPAASENAMGHMFALSLTFMALTFTVFVFYGICAGLFSELVLKSPKVIRNAQRSFALTFAALGTKLAFTDR